MYVTSWSYVGEDDSLVRYAWGEASARRLAAELPRSDVAFVAYPHIDHELDESMVRRPLI